LAEDSAEVARLRDLVRRQQQLIDSLVRLVEPDADAPAPLDPPAPRDADADAPAPAERDTPVDWLRLSGAERLAAWQGLWRFVSVLVQRYRLQFDVRPCWWLHADAVDELTALWHIRDVCFREGAGLSAAATWQDNFHKSRERLSLIFPSCRTEHVDAGTPPWMTDAMSEAFFRHIQQEFHTRKAGA
jgi:hypothetical protein